MRELATVIPDADVLLRLTPEELGGKLLFLIRKRVQPVNKFSPYNFSHELWRPAAQGSQPYPEQLREQITLALAEAWVGWSLKAYLFRPSMRSEMDRIN
ncbi:MAG: hypothetical protein BGO25_05215 [Acidobacteriales bacterium 59-55]|nr:MAG: hypothetical protein BGO25_05215 [Acidobacteriales bacterium 59-55]